MGGGLMEFFVILVIVMVAFNAINTVIQKARQAQQAPPVRVVRVSPPELSDKPPERLRRIREERPKPSEEPEWAGEGKTLEWHGYDPVAIAEAQQHGEEDEASNTAVTANLTKILHNKDDLVAAFIFHEILEKPRAMQRR
jgi:hypothetical protein